MVLSVDPLDRKIIEALAKDGRVPFTELARRFDVAEATIRLRVTRLQESEVLRIVALCNPLYLGHQSVRLLLTVRDLTPRAVARTLTDLPMINHVALVVGSQDIYVEATCRDQEQLVMLLDEVRMLPGVAGVQTLLLLKLHKDYSWHGLASAVGQAINEEESAP